MSSKDDESQEIKDIHKEPHSGQKRGISAAKQAATTPLLR